FYFSPKEGLFIFLFLFLFCLGCSPNQNKNQVSHQKNVSRSSSEKSLKNRILWHSWNQAVLKTAQKENKPICLYIYSPLSFWCYKGEKLFQNPRLLPYFQAFYMVRGNIFDYPELEKVYGQKGLPSLVFFTPQGRFFGLLYGYQPPKKVEAFLQQILNLYQNKRLLQKRFEVIVKRKKARKEEFEALYLSKNEIRSDLYQEFDQWCRRNFDLYFGGFGKGYKVFHFPVYLYFLLKYRREGQNILIQKLEKTLHQIEISPLFDRYDYGFHRLAGKRNWDDPFLEKTLSANSEFLMAYSLLALFTGKEEYKVKAWKLYQYIHDRFRLKEGGYSVGIPFGFLKTGSFSCYTWSQKELQKLLKPEEWKVVELYYGLDQRGDKNKMLLSIYRSEDEISQLLKIPLSQVQLLLKNSIQKIKKRRKEKGNPKPLSQETISSQAQWLIALFWAYRGLKKEEILNTALEELFYLEKRYLKDKIFVHPKGQILLEDQLWMALAYLEAFLVRPFSKYLQKGKNCLEWVLQNLKVNKDRGGFRIGKGWKGLASRPLAKMDFFENVLAAYVLVRYSFFFNLPKWKEESFKIFRLLGSIHTRFGQFAAFFHIALRLYLKPPPLITLSKRNKNAYSLWKKLYLNCCF
ncbi:MAG: thioredoxin domain-containing protein, partial [Planctomycetota bacterium]